MAKPPVKKASNAAPAPAAAAAPATTSVSPGPIEMIEPAVSHLVPVGTSLIDYPGSPIGVRARCVLTGVEGVIEGRVDHLNGCIHYLVLAKPEGVPLDSEKHRVWSLDAQQLDYVGPGVSARCTPPKPYSDGGIVLGQKVEDAITGFKGIAEKRHIDVNGCVHYTVVAKDIEPPKKKKLFKKQSSAASLLALDQVDRKISAERLKIVDNGIVPVVAPKREANTADGKPTGSSRQMVSTHVSSRHM